MKVSDIDFGKDGRTVITFEDGTSKEIKCDYTIDTSFTNPVFPLGILVCSLADRIEKLEKLEKRVERIEDETVEYRIRNKRLC